MCLKLENLLGVLSLGKINSPSFAAFHLGLEPCEIYPMHTEMLTSVVIVQVLFRQAYLLRFLAYNFSVLCRGFYFTAGTLFSGSESFCSFCDIL